MKRKGSDSVIDDLPDHLADLPWWAGLILAFVVFSALYWILPALVPSQDAPNTKIPTAQAAQAIWIPVLRAVAPGATGLALLDWLLSLETKRSPRLRENHIPNKE